MGGILLNAAVGAMLWRPVETINIRPRVPSSTSKILPVPSLSARTPSANEQVVTPLIRDLSATREDFGASTILPEVRDATELTR